MTEIKWFKLDSHTFDTAEMRYLGKADKDGALYQLIWIKLLCEAAKRGEGGRIYIYKDRYVKFRELSMLLDMDENVICDALSLFVALDMIKYDETSGLVIKNFSEYVGEGYGTREEYAAPEGEEEFAEQELSEEERRREYNREAKRRSREKRRLQQEAEDGVCADPYNTNERNPNVKAVKNEFDSVKTVKNDVKNEFDSVKDVNDYVIDSVKNVKQNVKNSPKNIFIEENRIEESRIEDKRKAEIRKEETNNNLSRSLSDNAHGGFGIADGGEYKSVSCKGASHTLASPPHAHAEAKENENVNNYYGIFNNVCLSESELTRLRVEFGDTLPELIDDLSAGMESEGRSYNNHFATLLRWGKNKYAPRRKAGFDGAAYARSAAGDIGGASRDSFGGKAQKKDSYRGGFEPPRTITDEEAEEAFRLALERSAASG